MQSKPDTTVFRLMLLWSNIVKCHRPLSEQVSQQEQQIVLFCGIHPLFVYSIIQNFTGLDIKVCQLCGFHTNGLAVFPY
jgi:hypothetical protein